MALQDDDLTVQAWLRLLLVPGLGGSGLQQLLGYFSDPEQILSSSVAELKSLPGKLSRPLLKLKANNEAQEQLNRRLKHSLQWLDEPNHHLIKLGDKAFPESLAQIADPPPLLFVAGDLNILTEPQIAIVGTRKPSSAGRKAAFEMAKELAQDGLTITSGMAIGIDGAAHSGAIEARGSTIAILGCGCDQNYPRSHHALQENLLNSGGALVSEFPPGTPPMASLFPRRNRIISGLSLGVLVVEAALRSGSLITARCALEQGREVFAMPGSIQNSMTRGCHELIRQGAKLVESAPHILEELHLPLQHCLKESRTKSELPKELSVLYETIGFDVCPLDLLVARTGMSVEKLTEQLFELELAGLVQSVAGGVVRA